MLPDNFDNTRNKLYAAISLLKEVRDFAIARSTEYHGESQNCAYDSSYRKTLFDYAAQFKFLANDCKTTIHEIIQNGPLTQLNKIEQVMLEPKETS